MKSVMMFGSDIVFIYSYAGLSREAIPSPTDWPSGQSTLAAKIL
jgi:hypothetical protein